MTMRKCKACGKGARKMQRAIVLTIKGGRTGQVCASCARLGWLLVMGDDSPPKSKRKPAQLRTPGEISQYLRSGS